MGLQLGVNIDHVATLRQARYALMPDAHNVEPDILEAALACERAGAHGITVHLRADRRHIQDADLPRLREHIASNINLELGNTPEIVETALRIRPNDACLVPEKREEITTEGGLDVAGGGDSLRKTVERLQDAGIRVSLFIDPDPHQIEASARLKAEMIELHTGAFANAGNEEEQSAEYEKLRRGAEMAHTLGLQVNAGHGVNYTNIKTIRNLPHLVELNIGHSIVSRAVFVGLETAVKEMLRAIS